MLGKAAPPLGDYWVPACAFGQPLGPFGDISRPNVTCGDNISGFQELPMYYAAAGYQPSVFTILNPGATTLALSYPRDAQAGAVGAREPCPILRCWKAMQ
jgi:hypothetical protein